MANSSGVSPGDRSPISRSDKLDPVRRGKGRERRYEKHCNAVSVDLRVLRIVVYLVYQPLRRRRPLPYSCLSLSGGACGDRPWRGAQGRYGITTTGIFHRRKRAKAKKGEKHREGWEGRGLHDGPLHAQWWWRSADVSFVCLGFGEGLLCVLCVLDPLLACSFRRCSQW